MDLTPYLEDLRRELLAAAEAGGTAPLAATMAPAVRLAMLEVLAAAAADISTQLSPGSVEVRLRGRDPVFVVTRPDTADGDAADQPSDQPPTERRAVASASPGRDGAVSRVNFRPPEQLKLRMEAAAAAEGLSTNAWLIRAAEAALAGSRDARRARPPGQYRGWVG